MNWKVFITIILIVILSIPATLYFVKPRTVVVENTVTQRDTLYFTIKETLPPDTVFINSKIIKIDTIIVPTIDTIKSIDNEPADTTVYSIMYKPDYYVSFKRFQKEMLKVDVSAYAPCAVDSFGIDAVFNYKKYDSLYHKPNIIIKNKKEFSKGFYVWLGAVSAVTLIALISKL